MSAEQFFQVVLLPQGEFARFLRADAKDKEALLQKLFGTDRFRKVEDWLADRRRASDKEVAAAEDGVGQLLARIAQAAGGAVPDSAAVLDSPGLARPLAALDQADGRAASGAWQATWAAALATMAAAERDAAAAFAEARKADLEATLVAQREAERLADRQRRRLDALRRKAGLEAAAPEIEWPAADHGRRDHGGRGPRGRGDGTALRRPAAAGQGGPPGSAARRRPPGRRGGRGGRGRPLARGRAGRRPRRRRGAGTCPPGRPPAGGAGP